MIHNPPEGWRGTSTILEVEGDEPADEVDFDDNSRTPDHRPIDAVFRFSETEGDGLKAKILSRIDKLQNELTS